MAGAKTTLIRGVTKGGTSDIGSAEKDILLRENLAIFSSYIYFANLNSILSYPNLSRCLLVVVLGYSH